MGKRFTDPDAVMQRAIELARQGLGAVEPNPPVGAVIVDDELELIAEGFHPAFGGPHAEIGALRAAGPKASGATLFVTLEPCCHHGKTPPCSQAVIKAGIRRVVIGTQDPAPHVDGDGIQELRDAGVDVEIGVQAEATANLIAPFRKLIQTGRPWVHAKWAMTLDGRIATRTGASQWISNEESRRIVHELRRRMDAIIVGSGTARADDPLLTARPSGPRTATRVVIDTNASLATDSQLVQTVDQAPVIVFASQTAPDFNVASLMNTGVEVVLLASADSHIDLVSVFEKLGERRMTNVLVEGGGNLLGSLFDASLVDEVHAFIAPTISGGSEALSPVLGHGAATIGESVKLHQPQTELLAENTYVHGFVARG